MEGRAFVVDDVVGKGKGALAARRLSRGDLVLACDPLVAVLEDPDFVCDRCFREADVAGPPLRRRCVGCRARFCSERCAEEGKTRHGRECAARGKAEERGDEEEEERDDVLAVVAVETAPDEERKEFDARLCWMPCEEAGRAEKVARRASEALGREVTAKRAEEIGGKMASNSFGLDVPMAEGEFNGDGEPDVNYLGRAIYVDASFFNHTCEAPNVARVRLGRRMYFLATRNVEVGEELCITYINSARHVDKNERCALLFELYGFHCTCKVCREDLGPQCELCRRCGCNSFLDQLCCVCDVEKIASLYLQL